MKKNLLSLVLLIATLTSQAQTIDFETTPTGQYLNWADIGGAVFNSYLANPSVSGINLSTTVASVTAKSKANGGEDWALVNAFNLNPVTFTAANCIVKMMVYKSSTHDVRLKFEGGPGGSQSAEISANYTTANTWQELTFDFTSEIGKTYASLSIMPDYTTNRPTDVTVYLDNISFNAPAPTVLVIDFETAPTGQYLNWADIGGAVFNSYLANPSVSGINLSGMVASVTAKSKANGGEDWALINAFNLNPVTFTAANCIVKMMVYKSSTHDVRLKFEGGPGGSQSAEISANYTTLNTWQELTFDFTSEIGKTYASLSIMPDYTTNRPTDVIVYLDNISFNDQSALPLKLLSFTGSYSNFKNKLNWETASELNFSKFEIEKSFDALKFEKIGEIKGGKNQYSFIDNNKGTESTAYYRLKMVDNDGSFAFSGVVVVKKKVLATNGVSVYPVPASDRLTINIQSDKTDVGLVNIYDISGKLLSAFSRPLQKGLNAIQINTTSFSAGNYFVTTKFNGGIEKTKFIVSK